MSADNRVIIHYQNSFDYGRVPHPGMGHYPAKDCLTMALLIMWEQHTSKLNIKMYVGKLKQRKA